MVKDFIYYNYYHYRFFNISIKSSLPYNKDKIKFNFIIIILKLYIFLDNLMSSKLFQINKYKTILF